MKKIWHHLVIIGKASKEFHKPKECSIAAFDATNMNLTHFLPGKDYVPLYTRGECIYLNAKTIALVLWLLLTEKTLSRLKYLYLKALLLQVRPILCVTLTDNHDWFHELSNELPKCDFVAIQNAVRYPALDAPMSINRKYNSTFLCFGECDILGFETDNIKFKCIKPVGCWKEVTLVSDVSATNIAPRPTILFISQGLLAFPRMFWEGVQSAQMQSWLDKMLPSSCLDVNFARPRRLPERFWQDSDHELNRLNYLILANYLRKLSKDLSIRIEVLMRPTKNLSRESRLEKRLWQRFLGESGVVHNVLDVKERNDVACRPMLRLALNSTYAIELMASCYRTILVDPLGLGVPFVKTSSCFWRDVTYETFQANVQRALRHSQPLMSCEEKLDASYFALNALSDRTVGQGATARIRAVLLSILDESRVDRTSNTTPLRKGGDAPRPSVLRFFSQLYD